MVGRLTYPGPELAIPLGVGLGLGLPLVAALAVAVTMVIKRKKPPLRHEVPSGGRGRLTESELRERISLGPVLLGNQAVQAQSTGPDGHPVERPDSMLAAFEWANREPNATGVGTFTDVSGGVGPDVDMLEYHMSPPPSGMIARPQLRQDLVDSSKSKRITYTRPMAAEEEDRLAAVDKNRNRKRGGQPDASGLAIRYRPGSVLDAYGERDIRHRDISVSPHNGQDYFNNPDTNPDYWSGRTEGRAVVTDEVIYANTIEGYEEPLYENSQLAGSSVGGQQATGWTEGGT